MLSIAMIGLILFGTITAMRIGPRARSLQAEARWWRMIREEQQSHATACRVQIAGTVRAASRLRTLGHNIYQAEELARQNVEYARWWRRNLAYTETMITYCSALEQKYEHAARYPWLAVDPDPPMPYWTEEPAQATDGELEPTGPNSGGDRENPRLTTRSERGFRADLSPRPVQPDRAPPVAAAR
jgi:hypothetical protein